MGYHLPLLLLQFVFMCQCDEHEDVAADGDPLPTLEAASLLSELATNPSVGCNWIGITCSQDGGTVLSIEWPSQGLVGPLGNAFASLVDLTVFDFENNELTGTIPSEIGLLTRLEVIHLEQNSFTGTIPSELGLLREIGRFDLEKNQLEGTIPPFLVANLPIVERLYLDNNNLQGTIPSELGLSRSLRRIRVNGNALTGTIPSEIADIPTLQRFYVNQNQLEGSIPAVLGVNPILSDMQMFGNSFTGSVPANLEAKGVCGENMYADENDDGSTCMHCPLLARSWAGSPALVDCQCDSNVAFVKEFGLGCGCSNGRYLDRVTMTCEQCSRGLQCDWDGNHTLSLHAPKTLPGYWAAPVQDISVFQGHIVYGCASSKLCIGVESDISVGQMITECEGDRLGTACALCPAGRVSTSTGPCTECNTNVSAWISSLVVLLLVFAQMFVLQALSIGDKFKMTMEKARSSTRAGAKSGGDSEEIVRAVSPGAEKGGEEKGGADGASATGGAGGGEEFRQIIVVAGAVMKHFQTVGLVSTMNIELPQEVFDWISSFRFLTPEFNVALGFACLTDGEFEAALVWTWLLPWIMVAICGVAFVLSKVIVPLSGGRMSSLEPLGLFVVIIATWLTFYTAFTDQVLMYWRCETRVGVARTNAFFRAVECGTDDYNSWMPLAAIFTVVNSTLPFVPVIYIAIVIFRGVGADGKLMKAFSFFFVNFRKGTRWWQVVSLTKDLFLLCVVLTFTEPFLQSTIMSAILAVYLAGLVLFRPTLKASNQRLECALIVFSISVMVFIGGGFSSTGLTDDEVSMRSIVSFMVLIPALVGPAIFVVLFAFITITPRGVKNAIRAKSAPARYFFNVLGFRDEVYDAKQLESSLSMVRVKPSDFEELIGRMDELERLTTDSSLKMLEQLASNGDQTSLVEKSGKEQGKIVTV